MKPNVSDLWAFAPAIGSKVAVILPHRGEQLVFVAAVASVTKRYLTCDGRWAGDQFRRRDGNQRGGHARVVPVTTELELADRVRRAEAKRRREAP